jgi:predicted transcriptional regulator YheO
MSKRNPEQKLLVEQLKQVALGLSKTLAPFCEVVVHDLLDPKHAILAIHNNLSGREVGDPTMELGLARISTGMQRDWPLLPDRSRRRTGER